MRFTLKLSTMPVSTFLCMWHAVGLYSIKVHQQLKQRQGRTHFKQWSLNSCFVTMTSGSSAEQTYHYIGWVDDSLFQSRKNTHSLHRIIRLLPLFLSTMSSLINIDFWGFFCFFFFCRMKRTSMLWGKKLKLLVWAVMFSVAINSFGVCQIKPGCSNLLNVNVRKRKLI